MKKGDKMKRLIEDNNTNPLIELMGLRCTFFCANYIYTGKLIGVNDTCVLLDDAGIVYETGALNTDKWSDMQALPKQWYVMLNAIESFGLLK